jgi:hypothetical protein
MASRSLRGRRATAASATRGDASLHALRHSRAVAALIAHEHRTAAAVFALLVLAYLWPALVPGHTLSPTALLQFEVPWGASTPTGAMRYVNGDLADVPTSYYPWTVLARAFVRSGTFPAWNSYAFGGTPLFANVQMAWASPFSLPLWILPLPWAFGVAAAFKLWAAGFGTYLLARELRLGFWAGVVSGISFALCAFNVAWLSHSVFVSVSALLPWSLWLTERIVRRGRGIDALALAAVVAAALAGGHPGTQVHLLAATVLYALVRVALGGPPSTRERVARIGLVGAALAIGALLTAVLLLPGERAAHDTVGALARRHGSPGFASSTLTPDTLRTALFPDWWGRLSEHVAAGPASYRERTFYAGAVALVLAAVALVTAGGWRRKAPFALLGVLGAAVALRTPGLWDLVIRLPAFDRIQNGRALLLFQLAVAALAGFGVQALRDAAVPRGRVVAVLAGALLLGLVAVTWLPAGDASGALGELVRRGSAAAAPAAMVLASVGWWVLLASATGVVALLAIRRPERRWLLGAALATLAAVDMLHFAHGYQPMGPTATIVPGRTPAIAFLQRNAGDARIAGLAARPEDWTLPADWSTTYGLRDIRGYDQPYPTQRYFRLWRLMDPSSITPYELAAFSPDGSKVLGVFGARYLIAPPGTRLGGPHLQVAYDGKDARIFANRLAMPRAIVARRVAIATHEDGELAALGAASFDPRTDAVARGDDLSQRPDPLGADDGTVRVVADDDDRVTLRATLARRGLVVLDDQWAPGWRVAIDGRAARPVRTDMVMRGVVVPPGSHEIVWSYRVPGLRAGAALSLIGLLAALAWAGFLLMRARRQPPRSTKPRPLSSAS